MRIPWSTLRGIGNSSAAKATILMPLIGYLFLFNGHFVTWLALHPATGVTTEATQAALGWRLLCLYYGLTLVAVATVVYALRCPYVCKRYADAVDYARDVRTIHASGSAFAGLIGELRRVKDSAETAPKSVLDAVRGELTLLGPPAQDAQAWGLLPAAERPSRVLRLLTAKYNVLDYSHRFARRTAATLYVLGLLLLAVPSANLFVSVTKQSMGMLLAAM